MTSLTNHFTGLKIMPKNEPCPVGQEIMTKDRCHEAQKVAYWFGLQPRRNVLQIGYWNNVPSHCSVQANTGEQWAKDDVHWNTNWDSDNSRFKSGEFQMICEAGKKDFRAE